jgi:DNA-binding HxlR family transcriptional regulator
MYERKIPEDLECGIIIAMKVLGGKWKPCLIDAIHRGIQRPSDLHRSIREATPRVLNMQIRELEEQGIISKKVYEGLPLRVEYFLTNAGLSILPIVQSMNKWGNENRDHIVSITKRGHEDTSFSTGRVVEAFH